ncbi:EthD family reductase [Shimazuella sp. AN120528]|uniref:EthD family reductase n=1 Tax=Shimazuella soli TaxID=1892854 RepID=UPI001F0F4B25|nr:EthD family reductase [Shimazuella soli]MCH5585980.1 EthD family reductase [Shimazuella soli]
MYKLMIIFKEPENAEEFEQFYYDDLIPTIVNVDGLERMELTKIRVPLGFTRDTPTPFDLQIEMYFQTKKSFEFFLNESEIGQEFQEKLSSYSEPIYTFAWGQTEVISKSEIVSRYNDFVINLTS